MFHQMTFAQPTSHRSHLLLRKSQLNHLKHNYERYKTSNTTIANQQNIYSKEHKKALGLIQTPPLPAPNWGAYVN
jgi:hypothetical protein